MDTYQLTMRNNSIFDEFMTRFQNRCSQQKAVSKRTQIICKYESSTLKCHWELQRHPKEQSVLYKVTACESLRISFDMQFMYYYEELKLSAYFSVLLRLSVYHLLHADEVQMLTMTKRLHVQNCCVVYYRCLNCNHNIIRFVRYIMSQLQPWNTWGASVTFDSAAYSNPRGTQMSSFLSHPCFTNYCRQFSVWSCKHPTTHHPQSLPPQHSLCLSENHTVQICS